MNCNAYLNTYLQSRRAKQSIMYEYEAKEIDSRGKWQAEGAPNEHVKREHTLDRRHNMHN